VTGRALCQFERSSLPEHSTGRWIVIRVVKELEPFLLVDKKYDGHLTMPKVGDLVLTRTRKSEVVRPWAISLDDKAVDQPLKILWDH
jgi:hypothetical protein